MKLGETLPPVNENLGLKDAVHVAVVAVQSEDDLGVQQVLKAGMPIRFTGDALSSVRPCKEGEEPHGVVDPFLKDSSRGFCLVVVNPKFTVGVMRHEWNFRPDTVKDFEVGQWDCRQCGVE